jgi:hypothetical protein
VCAAYVAKLFRRELPPVKELADGHSLRAKWLPLVEAVEHMHDLSTIRFDDPGPPFDEYLRGDAAEWEADGGTAASTPVDARTLAALLGDTPNTGRAGAA